MASRPLAIVAPSEARAFADLHSTQYLGTLGGGSMGLYLDDPSAGANNSTLTVTVSVVDGFLNGGTSHSVTYTGNVATVQSALAATSIAEPNATPSGSTTPVAQSDTVTIGVDDGQGNTATAKIGLDIVPAAFATVAAPATLAAVAGIATPVPGVVLTDPRAAVTSLINPIQLYESVSVSLVGSGGGPGTGALLVALDPRSSAIVSGNGTSNLSVNGPLDAVNAALATLAYVSAGNSDSINLYSGSNTTTVATTVSADPAPGRVLAWSNAAGGNVSTPANWSPAGPPGETDEADFGALTPPGTRGYVVTGTGSAGEVVVTGAVGFAGAQLADGIGGTSVRVANGGSLEVLTNDSLTAIGTVLIDDGTLRTEGTVSGATVSVGGTGAGALVGQLGTINTAGDLLVGDAATGSGALVLEGGYVSDNGNAVFGAGAGRDAFAALDAGRVTAESFTTSGGNVIVGGPGSGAPGDVGDALVWVGSPGNSNLYAYDIALVGAGGRVDLTGTQLSGNVVDVAPGGWIGGTGTIIAYTNGPAPDGTITVDGIVEATASPGSSFGNDLQLFPSSYYGGNPTAVVGSGELLIDAGATLYVGPTITLTGAGHVRFAAGVGQDGFGASNYGQAGGMLVLQTAVGAVAAPIDGFADGDRIELLNAAITSLSYAGSTLTVNGGTPAEVDLTVNGSYTTANFGFAANSDTIYYQPNAANSPRVLLPGPARVAQGAALPLSGIDVIDPQPSATSYQAVLTAGAGSLAYTGPVAFVTVSSTGPGNLTIASGDVTSLDAALQFVTYTPAAGAAAGSTDTVTLSVTDGASTTPYASGPLAIPVTVTAPATYTWRGDIGTWSDAANWSAGGPPSAGDTAAFTGGNSVVQGTATAGEITAASSAQATFTGIVTLSPVVIPFPGANAAGTSLHVDGGANLVFDTGSSLASVGGLVVGDTGAGRLVLASGSDRGAAAGSTPGTFAPVTASTLAAGVTTGGDGTVFLDSATALSGDATIGLAGTGELNIDAAGGLTDANATLGADATPPESRAFGRAFVNAGEWQNAGTLAVGGQADGQLRIEGYNPSSPPFHDNAPSLNNASFWNGSLPGVADGYLNFILAGAPVTAADYGHGVVGSGQTLIGRDAGSTGSVLVEQGNADLSTQTRLAVGLDGAGTLRITNQALADVVNDSAHGGVAEVGADAGGSGTLIVSGGTFADLADLTVGGTEAGAGGTGLVEIGASDYDNSTFTVYGTTDVWSTGTVAITGAAMQTAALSVAAGGLVRGHGVVEGIVNAGFGSPPTAPLTAIANAGLIVADGGKLTLYGAVAGAGTVAVDAGAELELPRDAAGTASFRGGNATLTIDDYPDFASTITGLAVTDTIHLTGIAADSASWAANVLSVFDGTTKVATLNVQGPYAGSTFYAASDGHDGADIGLLCFAAGTRIATPDGEAAVETLRAGDLVATAEGARVVHRAVRWVGRRRIDLARHARPEQAWPVRIAKSAFADGVPARDLFVSPDHAILCGEVLIPARLLVNGTTIARDATRRTVDYVHVELDRHAILLAEGLPAESYLDTGNRAFFDNAGLALTLHPDFAVNAALRCWAEDACAPLATDAARVAPVWRRLAARAAALGHAAPAHAAANADSLELCLQMAGRVIRPLSVDGARRVFALPPGAREVEVVSSASVPADVLGGCSDDRRRLGVAVARVVLRTGAEARELPLDGPAPGRGWWAVERHGACQWRWTNGAARLLLPPHDAGSALLELYVRATHAGAGLRRAG